MVADPIISAFWETEVGVQVRTQLGQLSNLRRPCLKGNIVTIKGWGPSSVCRTWVQSPVPKPDFCSVSWSFISMRCNYVYLIHDISMCLVEKGLRVGASVYLHMQTNNSIGILSLRCLLWNMDFLQCEPMTRDSDPQKTWSLPKVNLWLMRSTLRAKLGFANLVPVIMPGNGQKQQGGCLLPCFEFRSRPGQSTTDICANFVPEVHR